MSKKGAISKALAKKVYQPGRVVEVKDIEDTVKSPFFSPVQTRGQRKVNKTQLHKLVQPAKAPANCLKEQDDFKEMICNPGSSGKSRQLTDDKALVKDDTSKLNRSGNPEAKEMENSDKWEPKNWRLMLENIRAMRSATDAPVDTMGCHKCSDNEADEKTQRFQKLVALMLSSQTKDEITYEAMQRLKDNQMTPEIIVTMERSKLEELLKPVSFYKNKAKYLQLASQILIDKYSCDIPGTIKELEALPGVGPKMAHICMATAWNEVTGIGVDVHVHRITNRLMWLPKPTKQPEQTRVALESWLPQGLWQEVNHLLVGFGQTVCKAVRPHCVECLNREICPASEHKPGPKKNLIIDNCKNEIAPKKSKLKK
ncbi:endonuclease III-like protein 1 isoform X1 [Rhagoletis pomonella]|uniref:endonuclease III-like protein 1 isoform X1 n=1 Tax=Rhagoletis pomonella TaxID=28610 RepID=UPI00177A7DA3|nr:endonuclease III-like protein 1 isoform X1 [Rhagoletis pomonella]